MYFFPHIEESYHLCIYVYIKRMNDYSQMTVNKPDLWYNHDINQQQELISIIQYYIIRSTFWPKRLIKAKNWFFNLEVFDHITERSIYILSFVLKFNNCQWFKTYFNHHITSWMVSVITGGCLFTDYYRLILSRVTKYITYANVVILNKYINATKINELYNTCWVKVMGN